MNCWTFWIRRKSLITGEGYNAELGDSNVIRKNSHKNLNQTVTRVASNFFDDEKSNTTNIQRVPYDFKQLE